VRQLAGVLVKDLPRYVRALTQRDRRGYLRLCNRTESLEAAPDQSGYRCLWEWGSDLHAPKHLPSLGRWLLNRALADHPIEFAAHPVTAGAPQVSFVIGHRGKERLPQLLATLSSIAAQRDVPVECIVVEQETESLLGPHLPAWVRHVHTPPADPGMAYCRSWAFNVGARHARGAVLVLHDSDMLISADYACSVVHRIAQGYDVVNLKRFVFYLTQDHTAGILDGRNALTHAAPAVIVQNLEAGGNVAISRAAFEQIGGMDESFVGWGGEDNEFWERAQTLSVWPFSCLPMVHLWHPAQPDKLAPDSPARKVFEASRTLAPAARIERLRAQQQGRRDGPRAGGHPCI